MKLNSSDWLRTLIGSPEITAMPVMMMPALAHMKKKVSEAVLSQSLLAEAVLFLAEQYPTPASIMMMDLSVEAEAFGADVRLDSFEAPSVCGRLLKESRDIKGLDVPGLDAGRIPVYLRAAGEVIVHAQKPVIASCIGPVSLAARLTDISELMTSLFLDPAAMHELIGKCTAFIFAYAAEYKRMGMNGIMIAEPVAGLLPPELCAEFSSAYVRGIVEELQSDEFPVILHNCGNTGPLINELQASGAAGLSLGNACDIEKALADISGSTLVMGNIDPALLQLGSTNEVRIETDKKLELANRYGNYIISSGCDIPYDTPLENIGILFDTVAEFNLSGKSLI